MKIVSDVSVLRQKSERIEDIDEINEIIEKLQKELDKIPHGIGLCAIQIGIPKRVGVIRYKGDETILINPEVVDLEDEIIYPNEGCLSFPNQFRNTKRYQNVTIYNDVIRDGELKREKWGFYYAPDPTEPGNMGIRTIAVQHELDHMDGKLLLDHEVKSEPIKNEEKKVGRNDPCPCGSGKKYKKCCLN